MRSASSHACPTSTFYPYPNYLPKFMREREREKRVSKVQNKQKLNHHIY